MNKIVFFLSNKHVHVRFFTAEVLNVYITENVQMFFYPEVLNVYITENVQMCIMIFVRGNYFLLKKTVPHVQPKLGLPYKKKCWYLCKMPSGNPNLHSRPLVTHSGSPIKPNLGPLA